MNKLIVLIVLCAGIAGAQPTPSAGSASPPPTAGAPSPSQDPAALRKICVDALNADPAFAKKISGTFIDQEIVDTHEAAVKHVQRNERHVYLAYGAMWVIAALFVAFLWYRQQSLKREIARLRHDLDSAEAKS